jgi:hypothetical protein
MAELPISIVHVETPEGPRDFVTCLSQDVVFKRGLRPEAVIGTLMKSAGAGGTLSPENFARNPAFVDFMHKVIAEKAPGTAGFQAEARRLGKGHVYIIDQRTPIPGDAVPPEDIVGAFEVNDGKVVLQSYKKSPNHRIFSTRGFVQLGPELQKCLLDELNQEEKK